jgi:isocitrate dehydrogenase
MPYKDIAPPAGEKISIDEGKLQVPDQPVIPFIRGDGTGPAIWAASVRVFDSRRRKRVRSKAEMADEAGRRFCADNSSVFAIPLDVMASED